MTRVIVFDVNETLLDLSALDPYFTAAFGEAAVRREWFSLTLQTAMVATLTGRYASFGELGRAALSLIASRRGDARLAAAWPGIAAEMRQLPPHPEVPDALQALRDAGFRLAALTNNAPDMAAEQLAHAGIRDRFSDVLSVESVRQFKPAPAVYHHAASALGVAPAGMRLVAAHGWDVAGAMAVGAAAAFVARPGQGLEPFAPAPDIIGPDLAAVASRIIAVDSPEAGGL